MKKERLLTVEAPGKRLVMWLLQHDHFNAGPPPSHLGCLLLDKLLGAVRRGPCLIVLQHQLSARHRVAPHGTAGTRC